MPNFVLTYRNPKGYVPTLESRANWMAWFEGMGDHLVELGQPVADRQSIGECSTERTELGGFSIIQADDFDAALAIAKGCPHLDGNGGVEIGLLTDVPPAA